MPKQRPLIGVPTQTLHSIEGIPDRLPPSWVMSQRYSLALIEAGGLPLMIPLVPRDRDTMRAIYGRLDGLFLAGGVDVDPETYGEERHPLCGRTDLDRDRTEILLARWAIEEGKPLLGACRGLQIVNVAAGGTLYQDLLAEMPGSMKHDYLPSDGYSRDHLAHDVAISEGTRLAGIFSASGARVNSMHHQGIKNLAPGLAASAIAPDGLIEALETKSRGFVVAVQWHPEALGADDSGTRRLLSAFISAAAEHRARPPLAVVSG